MAEMRVARVYSPGFERACMACVLAFGCIINDDGNGVLEISCFHHGDAEAIWDTLAGFGGSLLTVVYFEEE